MRVLVTGGSGYLGSAIVRALARRGHQPVSFSRHPPPSPTPVRAIVGDLRSRADVEAAVGQCDAVCHAGALVSLWRRRSRDFDEVNVNGTRHVLDACRA
ncbi:MAG: NAD(P)-dependent oxidoreductase, partial [Vicinamibacterales bacterium]